MSHWTDAESADLDRRNLELRKPDKATRSARPAPPNAGGRTSNYETGQPRGEATPQELQRRQVERAMQRRAQREGEQ